MLRCYRYGKLQKLPLEKHPRNHQRVPNMLLVSDHIKQKQQTSAKGIPSQTRISFL